MAVEPESYKANEAPPVRDQVSLVSLKRARNGRWSVTVNLEIDVRLPDGRLVTASQKVSIRGRGESKPHPDPKWLYEKVKTECD